MARVRVRARVRMRVRSGVRVRVGVRAGVRVRIRVRARGVPGVHALAKLNMRGAHARVEHVPA